jgi:glycosyltransferase involved in cell wall biosynthesis
MRLLFVCTAPGGGGLEIHFVALANAMHEAGHEVSVFVRRGDRIDQLLDAGIDRHYGIFRGAADPRGLWRLSRTVRRVRPDWMIGSLSKEYWPITLIGRRKRVPVVLFKHTATIMRRGSRKLLPGMVARFVVISDYMREYYIEQGIPAERVRVLHNLFDFARYRRDDGVRRRERQRLSLADEDVLVGFVGGFTRGKGILVLGEALNQAMERNPNIHGWWIGGGPEEAELRQLIDRGGHAARHHFHGWAEDSAPLYSAMDLLALPSIGTETFGRVCVEAEAAGVAVLGSDLGGIPETMADGISGRLLPPGDVAAWRDAILDLAADPALRARMGEAGRQFVGQRFSAAAIVDQFVELLQDPAR